MSLKVGGGWLRPIMHRSPEIARLFGFAKELAAQLGTDLHEVAVGGASDANFAAALGVPVLDGLGAIGSGAHSRREQVSARALPERAALAAGLIMRLGASEF